MSDSEKPTGTGTDRYPSEERDGEVVGHYHAMAGFLWGSGSFMDTDTRITKVPCYAGDDRLVLTKRALLTLRATGSDRYIPADAAVTHFELKRLELP